MGFRLVQIFAYIENIQIILKLGPTKNFARDYEITRFFLAQQLLVNYSDPDVPVNMVGAYHLLDGKRSMYHESKSSN